MAQDDALLSSPVRWHGRWGVLISSVSSRCDTTGAQNCGREPLAATRQGETGECARGRKRRFWPALEDVCFKGNFAK